MIHFGRWSLSICRALLINGATRTECCHGQEEKGCDAKGTLHEMENEGFNKNLMAFTRRRPLGFHPFPKNPSALQSERTLVPE